MKHVLILGASGMLGSAVAKKLTGSQKYNVTCTYRPGPAFDLLDELIPDTPLNKIDSFDPCQVVCEEEQYEYLLTTGDGAPYDFVINCIGIIKPNVQTVGIEKTILINSILPHTLARFCSDRQIKLIHITTDCVFSGRRGWYTESDPHDCEDAYGKSKSLGEPTDQAMVLRTSIIGPEIHNNSSLVAWAQSQAGKPVNGFLNHIWNGITTATYGSIVEKIMDDDLWAPGLFHVFSPRKMNKFELLSEINKRYDLHLDITPVNSPNPINRALWSTLTFCRSLGIPDLIQQIKEM